MSWKYPGAPDPIAPPPNPKPLGPTANHPSKDGTRARYHSPLPLALSSYGWLELPLGEGRHMPLDRWTEWRVVGKVEGGGMG